MAGNDTWSGFIVLTNHRIAFVEDGLVPGKHLWGGAIPLEQITNVTTDGELVISADGLGWTWCLRDLEISGFQSVGADSATVAGFLRDAVKSRKSEVEKEKGNRRRRINSFDATRRNT